MCTARDIRDKAWLFISSDGHPSFKGSPQTLRREQKAFGVSGNNPPETILGRKIFWKINSLSLSLSFSAKKNDEYCFHSDTKCIFAGVCACVCVCTRLQVAPFLHALDECAWVCTVPIFSSSRHRSFFLEFICRRRGTSPGAAFSRRTNFAAVCIRHYNVRVTWACAQT